MKIVKIKNIVNFFEERNLQKTGNTQKLFLLDGIKVEPWIHMLT
jgi:hypothetical protein